MLIADGGPRWNLDGASAVLLMSEAKARALGYTPLAYFKSWAYVGVDPAELRRRNLIPPDQFPYQTPVALPYDSGNYEPALDLVYA